VQVEVGTAYRASGNGALVRLASGVVQSLHAGQRVRFQEPGEVVEGGVKRIKRYRNKALQVGRDYQDKSL
jgi:surface antigen